MSMTLTAAPRTQLGSNRVRKLRREGSIPANLYGASTGSRALQVPGRELTRALRRAGTTALVDLAIEGEPASIPVMIRAIQYDPVSQALLHVDFHAVDLTKTLVVEVPIGFVGDSPAAHSSQRMLLTNLSTVRVECVPSMIPTSFQVDVSGLKDEGDQIRARDIALPEGVRLISDPEDVLIKVVLSRAGAREAAKGAGAAGAE